MKTEFQHIPLNEVRYSLVWEGYRTVYRGLNVQGSDRVLAITSAGCNALNLLLQSPKEVVAIDLNPVQNELLQLKMDLIRYGTYDGFADLLGLRGPEAARAGVKTAFRYLPAGAARRLSALCDSADFSGLLNLGRLERYMHGFLPTLNPLAQNQLKRMAQLGSVGVQRQFFGPNAHDYGFRNAFVPYFDRPNLSKGRDIRLFTHAEDAGGATFYERLVRRAHQFSLKEDFYFRFLFFGPAFLPEHLLPAAYQRAHFPTLQARLHLLTLVEGEAISYLLSEEGQRIHKASLSNVFEYTSKDEFLDACHRLFADGRSLRVLYWNLLNGQGEGPDYENWRNPVLSELLTRDETCFYFRNVQAYDSVAVERKSRERKGNHVLV